MKSSIYFFVLLLLLLVASCKKKQVETLPGKAPIASAVSSITTNYGNKVVLDGSASSDPDGDKITYRWSFKTRPSGSSAALPIVNDTQSKAEFEPDVTGQYVVTLSVSDNIWPAVTTDVTVTVNESPTVDICPQNGKIATNTTWKNLVQDPAKPDYIICKDIDLSAVLTIEPGVVIAFKQNAGLTVTSGGVLVAKGTAEKRIVFTGEQKQSGFWDGILFLSSDDVRNELSYVEVSYGGASISSGYYGKPANLNIAGNKFIGLSPSSATITNCTFKNSKGIGVYVSGDGSLTGFSNNNFANNMLYPIELPASQVGQLDENSSFTANDINYVAIYGTLNSTKETTWGPFKDGTKYRFTDSFSLTSGLVIKPGAVFEVASQKTIQVGGNGYLIANGTSGKRIVFTGEVKVPGSWGGIYCDNQDVRNEISYADLSYGGGAPAWLYADKGNIILSGGFGSKGRMKVTNCSISNSSEVGIANYRGTLVLDNPDSNTYSGNAKGNIGQ